jgi:hypothetical protein
LLPKPNKVANKSSYAKPNKVANQSFYVSEQENEAASEGPDDEHGNEWVGDLLVDHVGLRMETNPSIGNTRNLITCQCASTISQFILKAGRAILKMKSGAIIFHVCQRTRVFYNKEPVC